MDSQKIENAPKITFCRLRDDINNEDLDFRSEKFRDSLILVLNSPFERNVDGPPHTVSTNTLVWCNNEENKAEAFTDWDKCSFCDFRLYDDDTGYYLLREDIGQLYPTIFFHKECIKPIKNNPYHPKHSLQVLTFRYTNPNTICYCCYDCRKTNFYCSICNFCICSICEAKPPLLTIEHKKRHEHTLSYFPREASMTCDVCGLDERRFFLYICHQCDFIVHKECVYSPWVIKISRHEHRLSFVSSFFPGKWFCGICRKRVDENYGGYSCVKGCYYAAHTRCVLHNDVWDGKELEDQPEEIYEDISPFEEIADGIIQHFSHKHQMRLHKDINKIIEDSKHCQCCALPVYDGDIFSCMKCEFVLHKVCANLPLRKEHVMHRHPLFLQVGHTFECSACDRPSNSFTYMCHDCGFYLDVYCAAASESLFHHFHPHLMFLPSNLGSRRECSICEERNPPTHYECGECDFVMCLFCATLPTKFSYMNDEHLLTFSYEQDASGEHWCDLCEKKIYLKNVIYMCSKCDITLHINCLVGTEMYMLPGKAIIRFGGIEEETDILPNNRLTRYICNRCNKRCQNKIVYKRSDEIICCSILCLHMLEKQREMLEKQREMLEKHREMLRLQLNNEYKS